MKQQFIEKMNPWGSEMPHWTQPDQHVDISATAVCCSAAAVFEVWISCH